MIKRLRDQGTQETVGIARVFLRQVSVSEQYQVGVLPFPNITVAADVS